MINSQHNDDIYDEDDENDWQADMIEEYIEMAYGIEYPILLFEPKIDSEENKELKGLVHGNDSIHFLSCLSETFFTIHEPSLGFVLIFSSNKDETKIVKGLLASKFKYYRRMFDIEEETFLKDIFMGISDQTRNSLKSFVFFSQTDLELEELQNQHEEVLVMCDIKDLAKKFQQEYVVIWYDPDPSPADKEMLTKEVDIAQENNFSDFQRLCHRIFDSSGLPYHLIMTSKAESEKIINEMGQLKDSLLCLYIYCDDPDIAKIKKRKVYVEKKVEDLVPKVKQGIRSNSKLVNSFPAFATDFDASDRNDVYNLHYYLKGLIKFYSERQAREDFINLARKIYESKKLFEFEKDYEYYDKKKIFKWYTMESPVYKVINNCLRIASHDSILYCRYILRDLERAIKEEYTEKSHQYNGVVYRGAYISPEEWEKLQTNIGQEIEMFGFLSTSQNIETAKEFLFSDLKNKILITIIVPPLPVPKLNEQGFVNMSQNSSYQEAEILFNVRSKFRILEAGTFKVNKQGKECRHLVLMYGAQLLRKYMTKKEPSLSIELELPLDLKCNSCQTNSNLFAFHKEMVEVCCIECLATKSLPEDLPLLSLALPNPRKIIKRLSGTILNWNGNTVFPFYGYKCKDCLETGKERYLTWKNLNSGNIKRQCLECFLKKKKVESHLLVYESSPHTFWTEHQAAWETIHSDHQQEISETLEKQHFTGRYDVYMEVQRFDLCIEYEKQHILRLNRKRKRERERIESFRRLAMAYEKVGRNDEALRYLKNVLKFFKQFNEKNHEGAMRILQGLALVYSNMGEFQKAKKCSAKVVEMIISLNKTNNLSLANAYNDLVVFCRTLGEHEKAFEYHKKALEILIKVGDGKKILATAISDHNIASVYGDVGNFKESLEYEKKALEITKAIYGEKHIYTASSFNALGIIHEKLGKYQEALEYFFKAEKILVFVFGERHPHMASSYNNIGTVYKSLSDDQKVREYYLKALNIAKAMNREKESEISATAYAGLGSLYNEYSNLKQILQAKDYLLKALQIIKSILGEKNQKTVSSYNNLGSVYTSLGEYSKAEELFLKALDITKSIYGENHIGNLACYNNLAGLLGNLGQSEKAIQYFIKALDIAKSVYGESHLMTAHLYRNLGVHYGKLENYQKAKDYNKKALDLQKSTLGECHVEIASSYSNLGVLEIHLRNKKGAIECFEKALHIRKSLFGENHPSAAELSRVLITLYNSLGEFKKC